MAIKVPTIIILLWQTICGRRCWCASLVCFLLRLYARFTRTFYWYQRHNTTIRRLIQFLSWLAVIHFSKMPINLLWVSVKKENWPTVWDSVYNDKSSKTNASSLAGRSKKTSVQIEFNRECGCFGNFPIFLRQRWYFCCASSRKCQLILSLHTSEVSAKEDTTHIHLPQFTFVNVSMWYRIVV